MLPPDGVLASPDYRLVDDELSLDGIHYQPRFDSGAPAKLLPFGAWFGETVLAWHNRSAVSRKELLAFVRNNVGGGHIAPGHHRTERTDRLVDLLRGEWLFLQQQMPDGTARGPERELLAFATMWPGARSCRACDIVPADI